MVIRLSLLLHGVLVTISMAIQWINLSSNSHYNKALINKGLLLSKSTPNKISNRCSQPNLKEHLYINHHLRCILHHHTVLSLFILHNQE